jgi:hypothetical protein
VLSSVADSAIADARPFDIEVRFNGKPLSLSMLLASPTFPPEYTMTASYAAPCDETDYLAVEWGFPGTDRGAAYPSVHQYIVPTYCSGAIMPLPPREFRPEKASLHPAIEGWSIDFPQILYALKANPALFQRGAERVHITTTGRLRLVDHRRKGCEFAVYNGRADQRRLPGVEDGRAIVEILETGEQVKDGGRWDGHYLILDAHSGKVLESGTYSRGFLNPA